MSKNTAAPITKKRSEKRQRTVVLRCRVLPNERDEIEHRAQAMGVSLSILLRESALDRNIPKPRKPLPTPDRQVLSALAGQLGKVGGNLNQLAHQANRGGGLSPEILLSALAECRAVLVRVQEVLK